MTLHELNTLDNQQLKVELCKCCGSSVWVNKMLPYFPADDMVELLEDAEEQWYNCSEEDWKEAFAHHPKIGDIDSLRQKFAGTARWAESEQSGIQHTSQQVLEQLAAANVSYENKFGYIFIVCATGKSAEEILGILQSRLPNPPAEEIKIAMEEQNMITQLRLEKLLA